MQTLILYVVTAVLFLAIDAVGIRFLIKPIFDRHIADLYPAQMRVGPAAVFYLAYVAGLVWLVSLPALRADLPMQALVQGIVLGLLAYGTYEFTNLATLRQWSWEQVIADTLWGGALTGFAAWAGVSITRALTT